MIIHKEFYRDFVGTLNTKRAKLKAEIESFQWNEEDSYFEFDNLNQELDCFTSIQEYFMDSSRWAYFDNLELLIAYVQAIESTYRAINEYSQTVLPVDGRALIGITQAEWDELESIRHELSKKLLAWTIFTDFCKYGKIF